MPVKVTAAMSEGVDSSVAAALLLEQGYDVEGVMLHLWAEPEARENACCSLQAQKDAADVARILGIPFRVLDAAELFRRKVVEYFIATYTRGRTPNPCIVCNREVRFGFLLAGTALAMSSTHYQVDWSTGTTGSGGGMGSHHYAIQFTVGQTDIGLMQSSHYKACLGYWCEAGRLGYKTTMPLMLRRHH